jgi:hypothetical protein
MTQICNLQLGKRYTFYHKRSKSINVSFIRGTFLEIRDIDKLGKLIYIESCNEDAALKKFVISIIPLDLIKRVETLDEILQGRTRLITDVLHVIDDFL